MDFQAIGAAAITAAERILLAGRVPTVGVLTGFAVSVERHGEVIFDEELTCFILAGRRDACGDGVIDFRYDPLPPVALP